MKSSITQVYFDGRVKHMLILFLTKRETSNIIHNKNKIFFFGADSVSVVSDNVYSIDIDDTDSFKHMMHNKTARLVVIGDFPEVLIDNGSNIYNRPVFITDKSVVSALRIITKLGDNIESSDLKKIIDNFNSCTDSITGESGLSDMIYDLAATDSAIFSNNNTYGTYVASLFSGYNLSGPIIGRFVNSVFRKDMINISVPAISKTYQGDYYRRKIIRNVSILKNGELSISSKFGGPILPIIAGKSELLEKVLMKYKYLDIKEGVDKIYFSIIIPEMEKYTPRDLTSEISSAVDGERFYKDLKLSAVRSFSMSKPKDNLVKSEPSKYDRVEYASRKIIELSKEDNSIPKDNISELLGLLVSTRYSQDSNNREFRESILHSINLGRIKYGLKINLIKMFLYNSFIEDKDLIKEKNKYTIGNVSVRIREARDIREPGTY